MGNLQSNRIKVWKFLLFAILPGLIVAGLVWSANIYYDLDTQRTMVETPGGFTVSLGNVGIGIAAPTERLHVVGNILGTGNLVVGGTIDTGIGATEFR